MLSISVAKKNPLVLCRKEKYLFGKAQAVHECVLRTKRRVPLILKKLLDIVAIIF
jgi:hypothetical protein